MKIAAAAIVVALALAGMPDTGASAGGATGAPAAASRSSSSSSLSAWHDCGGAFECASLTVPVDYGSPAGPTLALAVVREPARDPASRIGSLVVNPGGPGVSGDTYLRAAAASFPRAVRDRFDLVSFDPRGVGGSDPVNCVDSLDSLFDQSFSPATPGERRGLTAAVQTLADACATRAPRLLAHVSTQETAQDLDRLRAALGDHRLTFVGFSYGTYLGALYASRYPHRVRALVLDGAIDSSIDAEAAVLDEVRGFEHSLRAFLADCSRRPHCPFHHDGEAASAYDVLRARTAEKPIPGSDGRVLNQTRFDAAVVDALYGGRAEWSFLAGGLEDAAQGNPATLLGLADEFAGRDPSGGDDNSLEAFWAISCRDGPVVGDVAATRPVEDEAFRLSPRLGPFIVNFSLPCSVWPVPALPPPGPLTATGAPPTLVIGTAHDPATPLVEAQSMARELDRGVLLVARGARHTAFLAGNPCVDGTVARYLVSLAVPTSGTHC